MRAAVLREKGRFSLEDLPMPTPGRGEVLVKVSHCAICGSDISRFATGRWSIGLVLGHEFVGSVAEVGEGVEGWAAGDRVVVDPITECGNCEWCLRGKGHLCPNRGGSGLVMGNNGGYAEYTKVKAVQLFRAPERVGEVESTMAQCLAVALHGFRRGEVKAGDKVVVIGAGPIGLFVAAQARLAGAGKVYVVEKAQGRKEAAAQMGADVVLDPTETEVRQQLVKLTGTGADVVFGCAGAPQAIENCFATVTPGGTVVLVAAHWKAEITSDVTDNEVTVKGTKAYTRREFGEAVDLLGSGKIDCRPLITSVEPLSNIQQVFETLQTITTQVKVLIAPSKMR
ncbi:MAG: alcohol dehydrogenase catalytic domain-containing protein [Chloroflexi bacterium]|nr:alcohol dehydrogenase catalytic domain-containing protein [Chloroflexota bacterium]